MYIDKKKSSLMPSFINCAYQGKYNDFIHQVFITGLIGVEVVNFIVNLLLYVFLLDREVYLSLILLITK